jgi:hypothetical protein
MIAPITIVLHWDNGAYINTAEESPELVSELCDQYGHPDHVEVRKGSEDNGKVFRPRVRVNE